MGHAVHILGIRHHGPGSARSVLRALDELKPDCVLIEGPPDADGQIAEAAKKDMKPPVALLVYDPDDAAEAVYYPMAEFSPEWQAIRWALRRKVPVRFMDLPQSHRLAIDAERRAKFKADLEAAMKAKAGEPADAAAAAGTGTVTVTDEGDAPDGELDLENPDDAAGLDAVAAALAGRVAEADPLQQLAEAAGFDDGERWWEHVVEHRREGGVEVFAAVREAMAELRMDRDRRMSEANKSTAAGKASADGKTGGDLPAPRRGVDADEPFREAWMRRTIRAALKERFANVAVVCGAWHAPALDVGTGDAGQSASGQSAAERDAAKEAARRDDDLLKGLPKRKTVATWVPWTYDHLSFASGYGAGVHSPGWYDHLWRTEDRVLPAWMTKVARLLRGRDIDCSSAHVIEAVRLSETLAGLRGRPLADLSDIADATRSVFCFDSDLAMRLIDRELLVGHVLGEVPEDTPMVPLQQDLTAAQRRLRLKPEALERELDLDLRNDTDRQRSVLLHRLRLLGVDWGTPGVDAGGKGTFHEYWQLRWEPAFAVKLIRAGTLGNTVAAAAGAALAKVAAETDELPTLTGRLQDAMLADLGEAAGALVRRIEAVAAVAADVRSLMEALPPLTRLARYGNVRGTDQTVVRQIIAGVVPRLTAGLGGAVASLNDEAAATVEQQLRQTHESLLQLDDATHTADWLDALARVLNQETVHGLVRGRCARLLMDAGRVDAAEVARRLSLTLSRGTDPAQGARWLEGFLSGSGLLLIHDARLLGIVDAWVSQIGGELFEELLPLLRRTFTTFPAGERRQIGQMLAKGGAGRAAAPAAGWSGPGPAEAAIDPARGSRALPLIVQLLGGKM